MIDENALQYLNHLERDCMQRYLSLLYKRLGENLHQIWLFGSAAQGSMWPDNSPMHSDIDILVLTSAPLSGEEQEDLVNETYPLFLECGRQIAPTFRTAKEFEFTENKQRQEFFDNVKSEGVVLYETGRGA